MKTRTRPEQINNILNSLDPDDKTMIELQTYIADLEAKQPDRPSKITRCLEAVALRHSAEAMASLEAYLSELEVAQQPIIAIQDGTDSQLDSDNPPRWSHQRSVERKQRQGMRASGKQNNY